MNILIFTQHQSHSKHNSLYGIARALKARPEVEHVFVASRSDQRNVDFFAGKSARALYGINIDNTFDFPADRLFDEEAAVIDFDQVDVIFLRIPYPC
ncbi:MAG: hypothetical protein R3B47_02525 [Bacteroidia bacterium]